MVFSSVIFLFLFLPIVLGCYYLLPGREAKNLWLVAASLLFYAFSGLWYVLLLLFSVFCNYLAGLFVSGRKSVLYAAVAVNLGILGIFKYLTFLVQTVDRLPGRDDPGAFHRSAGGYLVLHLSRAELCDRCIPE